MTEAIGTVFRRFDELGSALQAMMSLREEGVRVPRRPARTGKVIWKDATYPAIHDFLTNPAYAGAFVFGRTRTEHRVGPDGTKTTRVLHQPGSPPEEDPPQITYISHREDFSATTSDAAALTLISGATWSTRGPIEMSGPNVDGAAEPEAILIGRLPEEPPGTWIEALFEVTFNDVEESLTFSLERSNTDAVAEISFPTNPNHPTFVAEGEINPVDFEVNREDLSG